MRDKPDGAALMEMARAVLSGELLAELPESARYRARMVANAMAIAARETRDGARVREAERAVLAALYGETPSAAGTAELEPPDEALIRLNWWLAAEIRAGRRDGDERAHAILQDSAKARLRLANPKALRDGDGEKDQ